ncbi:MAG: PIN domain-containing protein [Verrucomicrobia bacterium]|nr:PIN domain-containing protein [Verrucomicrobiota bacterium]
MDLIDTSLWIDFFRPSTSAAVKAQIHALVKDTGIVLCEPVIFETLRAAPAKQRHFIELVFETIRVLPTTGTLWRDACRLGQKCANAGFSVSSMDLLIAQLALHHQTRLLTFDRDFTQIAKVAPLQLQALERRTA